MKNQQYKTNVWQEFLLFALVVILSLFVFSLISQLLYKLFDINVSLLQNVQYIHQFSERDATFLKLIDGITRIGLLGIPALLVPYFLRQKALDFTGLNSRFRISDMGLALLFLVVLFPFLEWLISWNASLRLPEGMQHIESWMQEKEHLAQSVMDLFLATGSFDVFLLNLLVVALLPAVLEEMFFRGLLQSLLIRWSGKTHLSVIASSLLFSLIHLQFYGFFPRFLLGLVFGYFFMWSRSLWLPIVLHFINNALTVIFVYTNSLGKTNVNIEEGMNSNNVVSIISFAVAAAFFLFLAYYYQRKKKASGDDSSWVSVFSTQVLAEAEILKGKLEAEGISAVIMNQRDSMYLTHGDIKLMVPPESLDQAKQIISEVNLEALRND